MFLPWNLFLAIVPLYFSYRMGRSANRFVAFLFLALWLLFFPNALYIITDLFHLKTRRGIPLWFDLLILMSAAFTGIIMGFLSMLEVELQLRKYFHNWVVPIILNVLFLSCGYGIYVGRYLRWNSWDLATHPSALIADLSFILLHPMQNKHCWMITLGFGVWLHIMYGYFTLLKNKERNVGPNLAPQE